MKKGEWQWEQIGKMIVVLVVLIILIGVIYAFRDKIIEIFKNFNWFF